MTKLITTTALALMLAAPAFAQDTPNNDINEQNNDLADRDLNSDDSPADDLTFDSGDDEFLFFRGADNRRFRIRRSDTMTDGQTAINDENQDLRDRDPNTPSN